MKEITCKIEERIVNVQVIITLRTCKDALKRWDMTTYVWHMAKLKRYKTIKAWSVAWSPQQSAGRLTRMNRLSSDHRTWHAANVVNSRVSRLVTRQISLAFCIAAGRALVNAPWLVIAIIASHVRFLLMIFAQGSCLICEYSQALS